MYHQILFDTCLNMPLKCWPQDSGKKRKKDNLKSSQGDPKTGKRSKPPKKVSEEVYNLDFVCLFAYVTFTLIFKSIFPPLFCECDICILVFCFPTDGY